MSIDKPRANASTPPAPIDVWTRGPQPARRRYAVAFGCLSLAALLPGCPANGVPDGTTSSESDAVGDPLLDAPSVFHGLGFLPTQSPSESTSSRANAVSADGSVVAGVVGGVPETQRAFRWSGGTMIDLSSLQAPPSSEGSATGISADGGVIVGFSPPSSYAGGAYRWTGDTGAFLESVEDDTLTWATAASADGSVIVGHTTGYQPRTYAIRWSGDATEILTDGVDPNDNPATVEEVVATDVSADGSVIVGSRVLSRIVGSCGENCSNTVRRSDAVRWEGETMILLGSLSNWPDPYDHRNYSNASAVSADGTAIVGWSINPMGQTEAFRWSDGAMIGLGVPPVQASGSSAASWAYDVSADGSVVVGYYYAWDPAFCHRTVPEYLGGPSGESCYVNRAFIWTADRGMRALKDELINEYGLTGEIVNWRLDAATAVSADGTTIVGYGLNPDGMYEAWRAVLRR